MMTQVGFISKIMEHYNSTDFADDNYRDVYFLTIIHDTLKTVINELKIDPAYRVTHEYMGAGMHNWQSYHNDRQIGYALSEEEAWSNCAEYHIKNLLKN